MRLKNPLPLIALLVLVIIACTKPFTQATAEITVATPPIIFQDGNGHDAAFVEQEGYTLRLRSTPAGYAGAAVDFWAQPDSTDPNAMPAQLLMLGTAYPSLTFTAGPDIALFAESTSFSAAKRGLLYEGSQLSYRNGDNETVAVGVATADPAWVPAPLGAGWVNYGNGYTAPAYRMAPSGEVVLKGTVFNNAQTKYQSNIILTLPNGYRPSEIFAFVVDAGGSYGRVEISPTGNVTLASGVFTRVSLDGIRFYP